MDIELIFQALVLCLPIVSLMVLRQTTKRIASKITAKLMMRMKDRRREYAECQLAFSKVSLINEVKQGKYNVHIGNHQQVSFLFCSEKVTDLLEKNKYWAEQVESLGGNIKGELMIGLKKKKFQ